MDYGLHLKGVAVEDFRRAGTSTFQPLDVGEREVVGRSECGVGWNGGWMGCVSDRQDDEAAQEGKGLR